MLISDVIARLRTETNSFGDRVFGAGEFASTIESTKDMILPAAFIVLGADDAVVRNNDVIVDRKPKMTVTLGVVIVVDNTTDIEGKAASDSVETLRDEVIADLDSWQPATGFEALKYQGGVLLEMTPTHLWYTLTFTALQLTSYLISYEVEVALQLAGDATTAGVITLLETAIDSLTGGTRMTGSDIEGGFDVLASGTLQYQTMFSAAQIAHDSNGPNIVLFIRLRVHKHLAAAIVESTYTEGDMLTHQTSFLNREWWRVVGVEEVAEGFPTLNFPSDITRS